EIIAAVVENSIQHNSHSFFMAPVNQFPELLFIAELRIYFHIVNCVVFMVGICFENRCEIDTINTEIRQIVKVIDNPLKVTAKKVVLCGIFTAPLQYTIRVI